MLHGEQRGEFAAENRLRAALDLPGPRLLLVNGETGAGARSLVERAVRGRVGGPRGTPEPIWHRFDPAPASLQWAGLSRALARGGFQVAAASADSVSSTRAGAGPGSLELLRDGLAADRLPRILILDEPRYLLDADPRAGPALARFWAAVRARALPLHLILLSDAPGALTPWLTDGDARMGPVDVIDVPLPGPSALRRLLSGWSARDRYLLWAALGGRPERIRHVDPGLGLSGNLQRLVLDPGGRLHRVPVAELVAAVRKPERYLGILAALAAGAREWGEIRRRVPELAGGSSLAPYLSALEEMGWVQASRSLDAGPDSRRRRYGLTDPFLGFWLRAVAPVQGRLRLEPPEHVWRDAVRPELEAWAAGLLPRATARALEETHPLPLGVPARRAGGIWGESCDLPLAGILANGASFYATCLWRRPPHPGDAARLEDEMRRTRFGFSRETRLRLVVADAPPTERLIRQAAREPYLRILGLDELF